jgi:hypothetical protein
MKGGVLNTIRYKLLGGLFPEGKKGIKLLGHRFYVGGKWEEIGKLQFDYMRSQGLQPEDVFLDVACGALRGGLHFIPYLKKGNYLAIEKEESLVHQGIDNELGRELYNLKAPEIIITDSFEFFKLSKKPAYSLALSLFTHLCSEDINLCLKNLAEFVEPGHRFYATFFEGSSDRNQKKSHSLDHFEYTRQEMESFGERNNWQAQYIGNWGHPRDLMMIVYIAQ